MADAVRGIFYTLSGIRSERGSCSDDDRKVKQHARRVKSIVQQPVKG